MSPERVEEAERRKINRKVFLPYFALSSYLTFDLPPLDKGILSPH